MKYTLAWIAAEGATFLLTIGVAVMAIAALLNLFEITSIFSTWFNTFYGPALLAVGLFGLRFLSKVTAAHFLHHLDDQDEDCRSE